MKKDTKQDELEQIYLIFAKPLYFYLLKLTGSHHTAEELVQETFYRATLSLDLFHEQEVKSWLFKVARNAYMDEWRKRKRWKWVSFFEQVIDSKEFLSPYGIPEEDLAEKEKLGEVNDVLELLPEQYRSILYLREHEEFSYEQIGETLELSGDQVKITLYRARQKFKTLSQRMGKTF
ncbi:sigma-70 family RNA polymerase sigma factor [Evansella tamaricis]|uniref:Sigma-70 family RNA polymerase sigma factor n=1 Tax=Evansella tamaricis TaxID=2069301 RepID=A0ABS6JP85_9BACI|nr:sigma-70 family RNA polymerase sigma factor [Evansella tamaricis]MBU9714200.1 sigma-70 family RNA polymerase sigma factor [Evansella tamaricis]